MYGVCAETGQDQYSAHFSVKHSVVYVAVYIGTSYRDTKYFCVINTYLYHLIGSLLQDTKSALLHGTVRTDTNQTLNLSRLSIKQVRALSILGRSSTE